MRSHPVHRILMMLLIALLIGVVAAPAEAKKPRRYNSNVVLVDWTICPTGADLTIGYTGEDLLPQEPNQAPALVIVDAQLPSSTGSLIGGPTEYAIADVENEELPDIAELPPEDQLVTDGDEIPSDSTSTGTLTHKAVVKVRWSQPVGIGDRVRVGFNDRESGSEVIRYGLFETVFCPTPGGDEPGDSSPGVTTPAPSLSTEEIRDLSKEIGTKSETGSGPGGSRVPRAECTIAGTSGDDRIEGTRGNDVICGFGGDDVIHGAGGLDVIDGANGDDRMRGGSGDDALLLGLRGNDRLNGNSGTDRVTGGAGNDRMNGSAGSDYAGGGSGDDRLTGGRGRDLLRGGSGADLLNARDGIRDSVHGGAGLDSATVDVPGASSGAPQARAHADRVRGVEQLQ
jgi:RTX calcium-binding nonapeptide repeat (4 copies)